MPEADEETGEINPDDLPGSLPGYLIDLTAEFSLGGEVLDDASAGPVLVLQKVFSI